MSEMTINRYVALLNGLLTRSGHAVAGFATANWYYLTGATVAEAADAVILSRQSFNTSKLICAPDWRSDEYSMLNTPNWRKLARTGRSKATVA
jgi:hypothetical protein